ncbi:MAG: cytochrome b/b6 domain-containing protein [Bacteroidota bacterium]
MGNHKLYLYPLWLRLWHVTNALLCLTLMFTGGFMHFGSNIISFAIAVKIHNVVGIILLVNYTIFVFGNLITNNGNHYILIFKGLFKRIFTQLRYYSFGMFKGEETPFPVSEENKFNPVQQITYYSIMYALLPILGITGIAMLFPEKVIFELFSIKGIVLIDFVHLIGGFCIVLFLVIHLYFSTVGEKISSHFKSIVTGWH